MEYLQRTKWQRQAAENVIGFTPQVFHESYGARWGRSMGAEGQGFVPVSGDETQLRELNAALRVVGRLPRILNLLLFVVFTFAAWIGSHVSEWPVLYVTCVAVPTFVPFALSLRIKAYATTDTFIVRSYVREHRFRYDDVMGFSPAGYSGLWTGFNGTTTWHSLALRAILVHKFRGANVELNATLTGRRASQKIAGLLNARVPDEMPPGSVPGVV